MENNLFDFYINGIVEDNTDYIGVFHILADSSTEKVKKFSFVSTHNSKIYDFELAPSNENFYNLIDNEAGVISEHEPAKKFAKEMNEQLPLMLTGEKIKKIFEFITTSRDPFLKNVLIKDIVEDIFKKIYKKSSLKIEIKYSLMNPEENIMDIVNDSNEVQQTSQSTTLIKIKINPVLDPVSGIPVNKIKVDDEVFFRVMDSNINYEKIQPFIAKDNSDADKNVYRGRVKNVSRMEASGSIQLTVSLGNVYIGECALQEELKIEANHNQQTAVEANVVNETSEYITEEGQEKLPVFIYLIIGAISLVVFVVMYLLFF
ncbi:MAG: hypothetical protein WC002_04890 [Candidatus Muiribacteriota bacterium]